MRLFAVSRIVLLAGRVRQPSNRSALVVLVSPAPAFEWLSGPGIPAAGARRSPSRRHNRTRRVAQFRRITLPLISPTLLLASIITIVGSLQVFAQIAVLTQGGPGVSTTVLVYYLYQQAFQFHAFGYGSALAVLLFAIVAVLTVLQWQLRRRWVFHES